MVKCTNLEVNVLPERFEGSDVLVAAGPEVLTQDLVRAGRSLQAWLAFGDPKKNIPMIMKILRYFFLFLMSPFNDRQQREFIVTRERVEEILWRRFGIVGRQVCEKTSLLSRLQ